MKEIRERFQLDRNAIEVLGLYHVYSELQNDDSKPDQYKLKAYHKKII